MVPRRNSGILSILLAPNMISYLPLVTFGQIDSFTQIYVLRQLIL